MTQLFIADPAQHKIASNNGPGELTLQSVLAFFRSSWKIMLPIVLISVIVGTVYALVASPIYQANALIKIDVSEGSARNGSTNLAALFESRSATNAEIEMIRTRAVVSQAVEQYNLDVVAKPVRMPILGGWFARKAEGLSTPGLLGYGHTAWGNESIKISAFRVPVGLERKAFSIVTGTDGTYQLRMGKSLDVVGRVGVELHQATAEGDLFILVNRINAAPGIEFSLAKLLKEDVAESLQRALVISERGKQSGLISVSLEGPDASLNANVVNAISRNYIQQNVNLKTEDVERSLGFLDTQLPILKAAIDTAEAKYSAFRNARGTIDVAEESKSVLQQSVLAQTRLAELKQRRAELSTRFQSSNQFVEGINQEINAVGAEITSINEKIRRLPTIEQDLVRLTRDVKVNNELYAALLNTSQQLRLSKASRVGSAKLIDAAVASSTPVGPKRGLIIVGAAVVGVILAMFTAFLRRAVRSSIENQKELLQGISIPLIAVVPHSKYQGRLDDRRSDKRGRVCLLAHDASDEGAVESLRTLSAALYYASRRAPNNVVLIAGPTADVGKSFIAANLCAVLASTGSKVLLIDCDLRSGYLHRYFARARGVGFKELIVKEAQTQNVVSNDVLPSLDFISTGSAQLQPSEALNSQDVGPLLASFSKNYDYVIVDSAPVLAVADSLVLAKYAGMILCVARKGQTTIAQISETNARFAQSGHPVDGVIFNDVQPSDLTYGYGADYRRRKGLVPPVSAVASLK